MTRLWSARRWCGFVIVALGATVLDASAADALNAEATLRWDDRSAGTRGPLAAAERLVPGLTDTPRDAALAQFELRGTQRAPETPFALHGNLLLEHQRRAGGASVDGSRVNELHASLDLGAWQLGAGKKVLGWDVGYAFRPNDVVQQEQRRQQWTQTPEGRPLLMVEHFADAGSAWSLVFVQPERWDDPAQTQRGARESALALRVYRRDGALDWHAFARHGRHTGASLGAALSWVASDALELHASVRAIETIDAWRSPLGATAALAIADPWRLEPRRGGAQALVGGQWTGADRQSLLVEAWHDDEAPSDAQWRDWGARNAALQAFAAASGAPSALRPAIAGNLAWQGSPLAGANLRRDNVFVRLAWQGEAWSGSLDALWTPADRGHVVTATASWQGDRTRVSASWRAYGGPADALFAQLPVRRSVGLAASVAF